MIIKTIKLIKTVIERVIKEIKLNPKLYHLPIYKNSWFNKIVVIDKIN
jgi:hypothetical protein